MKILTVAFVSIYLSANKLQFSSAFENVTEISDTKFTSCDIENLDKCVQVLISLEFPRTEVEIESKCAKMKSAIKCTYDWGKACIKKVCIKLIKLVEKVGKNSYLYIFPCLEFFKALTTHCTRWWRKEHSRALSACSISSDN